MLRIVFFPFFLSAVLVVYGHPEVFKTNVALIQKCCSESQIFIDRECRYANGSGFNVWTPQFIDGIARSYVLHIGTPNCGTRIQWPIFHNEDNPHDVLKLLANGTLRHIVSKSLDDDEYSENSHDYNLGKYCIDKQIESTKGKESTFAMVCKPHITTISMDIDFIITKIIDPFLHIVAIVCYASVAVIHFVLPQLRDLVGNIITSVAVCLVVGQAAGLIKIFAEYNTYVDYFLTDVFMFVSLLGSYFWITLLGFYIWKTFRSRNVFLRITDGRKYCYYSFYVWSCTAFIAILAIFSHFMLDIPESSKPINTHKYHPEAETIGWLAMLIFYVPIAFSILMDIYFYVTTRQVLNRMTMYGRIHHKLKYSFDTYIKIFLVMTVAWVFFVLSWLSFDGTTYCYILTNGIEAPLILYISVLRQKKVRFLLKKSCCYEGCICPCFRPDTVNDIPDWGEEMMSMNL